MVMANTLTVSATTGADSEVTSLVIANVVSVNYDFVRQVVQVFTSDKNTPTEWDLTGVTTLTIDLSGSVYTLVLS